MGWMCGYFFPFENFVQYDTLKKMMMIAATDALVEDQC